jgi:hypothetical protein
LYLAVVFEIILSTYTFKPSFPQVSPKVIVFPETKEGVVGIRVPGVSYSGSQGIFISVYSFPG